MTLLYMEYLEYRHLWKTECKIEVLGGRKKENGELLPNEDRVSLKWWKDPEIESGNGYTTFRMYIMSLNCTPKNG